VKNTFDSLLTTEWALGNNKIHSIRLTKNCFSSTLVNRTSYSPLHLSQHSYLTPVYKLKTLIA